MKLFKINLHLFDGESGGTGAVDAGQQDGRAAAEHGNAATQVDHAAGDRDINAEFEEMIKGEYKDVFAKRTEKIVKARLKDANGLKATLNSQQPIMDILMDRYHAKDANDLLKALENDDLLYQEEADEKNMSVDQLRELKRLERRNKQLDREIEQERAEKRSREIYQNWLAEAEQVKQRYGAFDFQNEMQNPQFAQLVMSGVPLKAAYETTHIDDFLNGAMAYTAKKVASATAENIRKNGARPPEGGRSGAVNSTPDYAKMSTNEIRALLDKAIRG